MGLFNKIASLFQGEAEGDKLEDSSKIKEAEKETAAKKKTKKKTAAKKRTEKKAAVKKKAEEETAAIENAEEKSSAEKKAEEESAAIEKAEEKSVAKFNGLSISACEIVDRAYQNDNNLECVDLSSHRNLVKIGDLAFGGCQNLKEVILPDSIKEIGVYAFCDCKTLERVDLSSCRELVKISDATFTNCERLKDVLLPDSIKEIERNAFWHCSALRDIELPDSVEFIGETAFGQCNLKSLSLPRNLKEFSGIAFYPHIKKLDMSKCEKLRVISELRCSNKTIVIPMGVEEIDENVFVGCRPESVFLPPTINEVSGGLCTRNIDFYCYAPELEEIKEILENCHCFYVLPQYYDSYLEQAEAEGAEGCLDKISDDKLYFYDE